MHDAGRAGACGHERDADWALPTLPAAAGRRRAGARAQNDPPHQIRDVK